MVSCWLQQAQGTSLKLLRGAAYQKYHHRAHMTIYFVQSSLNIAHAYAEIVDLV